MKKSLLRIIIKECVQELLNEDETIGAPAPPADGLGSGEQVAIPTDKTNELKTYLTKLINKTLDEYFMEVDNNKTTSLSSNDNNSNNNNELTNYEKHKLEREKIKQSQQDLSQKKLELSTAQKKLEFNDKETQRLKSQDIPGLKKQIQQLSTPGI